MSLLDLVKTTKDLAVNWISNREQKNSRAISDTTDNGDSPIEQFIAKVEDVPGWLNPEAAYFSSHLLAFQNSINLSGHIVEIGIYYGKYLAILYQGLNSEDERVIGIDAFIGAAENDIEGAKNNVLKNIYEVCGDNSRLDILAANSLDLTSETLTEVLNGKEARFVSIDGGHTVDVVFHDLHLATAIIKEGGVIAMDDMFNHSLPGVSEGLFKFIFEDNSIALAPFAHCYNKLFLTTPDHHSNYFKQSLNALDKMKGYPTHKRTKNRMDENRSVNFVPQLFGYEVICFM